MSGHIFVSHSHLDGEYVAHLVEHLRGAGLSVWLDKGIDYGDAWPATIERQIESCAAVVVVMSTNSRSAAWVDREIDLAQDLGKPILPLLLNGRPLLRLRDLQYEEVTGGNPPSAAYVRRLKRAVGDRTGDPALLGPATGDPARRRLTDATAEQQAARVDRQWAAVSPTYPSVANRLLETGVPGGLSAMCTSPGGDQLATTHQDGTVHLWDLVSETEQYTLVGHAAPVLSLGYRPDGGCLGTVSSDYTLRIWNPASGASQHIAILEAGTIAKNVGSSPMMAFGHGILTITYHRKIHVYDSSTFKERNNFSAGVRFLFPPSALACAPDGRTVAVATEDKRIRMFDTGSGAVLRTLAAEAGVCWALAYSPDGAHLAAVAGGVLLVFRAGNGEPVHRLTLPNIKSTGTVVWSPRGDVIACTSYEDVPGPRDGRSLVCTWSVRSGNLVARAYLGARPRCIVHLANSIAVGREDGLIEIFNVSAGGHLRI